MKSIEERADEYADNRGGVNALLIKESFEDGAKSEHEELTKWNSPDDIPDTNKIVLIKLNDTPQYIFGYYNHQYECWVNWSTEFFIKNSFVGWREIHE